MNDILNFLGTFASIFSIPLAIILYFKTSDARQNKVRLEIIRSLSCRIGERNTLSKMEVSAVINSKVREHNIKNPLFNEVTIMEDIIADVISNPFLSSEQKNLIVENIKSVLKMCDVVEESKGLRSFAEKRREKKKRNAKVISKREYQSQVEKIIRKRKRNESLKSVKEKFSRIAVLFSLGATIWVTSYEDQYFWELAPIQIVISICISIGAIFLSGFIAYLVEKKIEKDNE